MGGDSLNLSNPTTTSLIHDRGPVGPCSQREHRNICIAQAVVVTQSFGGVGSRRFLHGKVPGIDGCLDVSRVWVACFESRCHNLLVDWLWNEATVRESQSGLQPVDTSEVDEWRRIEDEGFPHRSKSLKLAVESLVVNPRHVALV